MKTFNNNKEMVDYINSLGGRTVQILVLETCEACSAEFCATVQDANARKKKGSTVLCPVCRADDIRRQKRETAKKAQRWRRSQQK